MGPGFAATDLLVIQRQQLLRGQRREIPMSSELIGLRDDCCWLSDCRNISSQYQRPNCETGPQLDSFIPNDGIMIGSIHHNLKIGGSDVAERHNGKMRARIPMNRGRICTTAVDGHIQHHSGFPAPWRPSLPDTIVSSTRDEDCIL